MVQRARDLADIEQEAEVPYEQTRLARAAPAARRRLVSVLAVGALACAGAASWAREPTWLAGSGALALVAWGAWRARLGAYVAAALAAALAFGLALRALVVPPRPEAPAIGALVACIALALACAPPLVTLFRDAELQHAFGRWARREA